MDLTYAEWELVLDGLHFRALQRRAMAKDQRPIRRNELLEQADRYQALHDRLAARFRAEVEAGRLRRATPPEPTAAPDPAGP